MTLCDKNDYKCPFHPGSECGWRWRSLLGDGVVADIDRCIRNFRDKEDMFADIYATLVATYFVHNSKVYARKVFHYDLYCDFYKRYYNGKSSACIKGLTYHTNVMQQTTIMPNALLRSIVHDLSEDYLRFCTKIRSYRRGSLVDRCYRVLSWEDIVYEPYSSKVDELGNFLPPSYHRCVYSMNNMTAQKKVRLIREFDNNTSFRGDGYHKVSKFVPKALQCLFKALDCDDKVGTVAFYYDPVNYVHYVKLSTGGGLCAMPIGKSTYKGTKTTFHNSGKKVFLFEASFRWFHRWIMSVFAGNPIPFKNVAVVRQKGEWRKEFEDLTDEALSGLMEKMREFFIPSVPLIFLSDVLYKKRMKIETGNVINVGVTFWHGGAKRFAKYMNCDNDKIFWAQGDIKKIDKNIQDWVLMLYIASGRRYFDWANMDEASTKALDYLIKTLMYNLTNKVVLHLGGFWRFMRGVMPSGAKETSHGDSWIMAFAFFCYIVSVADANPSLSKLIYWALDNGFIAISVYGDNHLWCSLKRLRNVINIQSFSLFLEECFRMTLREHKEYDFFFSEYDYRGFLTKAGPCFIKVYFVKNNDISMCDILPFKPIQETMVNLFLKDPDDGPVDFLLSAIGQAWDTRATNIIAYQYVKRFYEMVIERLPYTLPRDAIRNCVFDSNKEALVTKIMRRIDITDKDLLTTFPTLDDMKRRHVYNEDLHKFGIDSLGYDLEILDQSYLF